MKRLHLFEFEDYAWFPSVFRNYITDIMRYAYKLTGMYDCAIPLIEKMLECVKGKKIVDLCSGSGGPWEQLHQKITEQLGAITITLTDQFPNPNSYDKEKNTITRKIEYMAEPVDACNLPADLKGVRTIFSGFHHFRPAVVKEILKSVIAQNAAIGIFEHTERHFKAIGLFLLNPLFVLFITPFIRPLTLSRVLWTYIIPVIPIVFSWDALVSCLRTYSIKELEAIVKGIMNKGYTWETGVCNNLNSRFPIKVTYLLVYPDVKKEKKGGNMLKAKKTFSIIIFVAISFVSCIAYADKLNPKESSSTKQINQKVPKIEEGEIYYTKTNMWFERPKNFLSTNFHVGIIIPAGTKVKILRCSGKEIHFNDEENGVTYTYIHAKKHSIIGLEELFYRYFSKENVMAEGKEFSKFTKEEQENIKQGIITPGMSKEAVIMAYGYPPTHKTQNLTSNVWTYWNSRADRRVIYFKDGVVLKIES